MSVVSSERETRCGDVRTNCKEQRESSEGKSARRKLGFYFAMLCNLKMKLLEKKKKEKKKVLVCAGRSGVVWGGVGCVCVCVLGGKLLAAKNVTGRSLEFSLK